ACAEAMGEDPFLAAIRANPDDNAVRLVYADWLQERGDPRGEFLRLDTMLTGLSPNHESYGADRFRLEQLRSTLDPHWLAVLDRSDRYTMLWPEDYCRYVASTGGVGQALRFVWG